LDSDFLLPSIKFQVGKLQNCASSHGMNLGSYGEELCMLTERSIEEPNLRRSAEMKNMLYDPLCFVFQPSSKLELIHIWD
ncbi:unnamed protein product, partial [Brassica rapa]